MGERLKLFGHDTGINMPNMEAGMGLLIVFIILIIAAVTSAFIVFGYNPKDIIGDILRMMTFGMINI